MSRWFFGGLLCFYYKLPTYFVYFTIALAEVFRLVALEPYLAKFYCIIFGIQLLNIIVTSILKAKYYKDKTTRLMCSFFYGAIFVLTLGISFLDSTYSNIIIMAIPWVYTFIAYEVRRYYLNRNFNEVLKNPTRIIISAIDKIVCFVIPVAILFILLYKIHLPAIIFATFVIIYVAMIPYMAYAEDYSGEDIISIGKYFADDEEDDDIDFDDYDDNDDN